MLDSITNAFGQGCEAPTEKMAYSFWNKSFVKVHPVTCIPMSLRDDRKATCFNVSSLGYKNFYPWFLKDENPASIDGYFNVVLDILMYVDDNLEQEEYWFFRADINILMMWFRVSICFVFVLFVLDGLEH